MNQIEKCKNIFISVVRLMIMLITIQPSLIMTLLLPQYLYQKSPSIVFYRPTLSLKKNVNSSKSNNKETTERYNRTSIRYMSTLNLSTNISNGNRTRNFQQQHPQKFRTKQQQFNQEQYDQEKSQQQAKEYDIINSNFFRFRIHRYLNQNMFYSFLVILMLYSNLLLMSFLLRHLNLLLNLPNQNRNLFRTRNL